MFCIVVKDDNQMLYFSGWEGPSIAPETGELTYWTTSLADSDVIIYDDHEEADIELRLITDNENDNFSIGIPDDFDIDNAYIGIKKVKQTHD